MYPGKEIVPAGLYYYRMHDPIVAKKDVKTTVEEQILSELQMQGATVDGKNAKALSEEEFRVVSEFAKAKVAQIGTEILSGNTEVSPYKLGNKDGCAYCPYHAVCGFDEKIDGYEHRDLQTLGRDEALAKMRREAGPWQ